MPGKKYYTKEEKETARRMCKIRINMRKCREKYYIWESEFFRLNETIGNKFNVKDFSI